MRGRHLFLGLCLSVAAPAAAQEVPGASLRGTVYDAGGQPLPRAQLRVMGLERSTLADGRGTYSFRDLPAGTHRVEATLMGYAPATRLVRVPGQRFPGLLVEAQVTAG